MTPPDENTALGLIEFILPDCEYNFEPGTPVTIGGPGGRKVGEVIAAYTVLGDTYVLTSLDKINDDDDLVIGPSLDKIKIEFSVKNEI